MLIGLGAVLAGTGSLLSGIAAIRTARQKGAEEEAAAEAEADVVKVVEVVQ